MYEIDRVVTDSEGLGKEDEKTIPNTSYENAKAYPEIKGSDSQQTTETNYTESKS